MKNLVIRALTGAVYVAFIIGGLCFHPVLFLLAFSVITALTLWEFYGLIKDYTCSLPQRIIHTAGGVYFFFAVCRYAGGDAGGTVFLPCLLFVMFMFISTLYVKKGNPIHTWAYTLLGQVYCAGPFALLSLIVLSPSDAGTVIAPLFGLAMFVFVWLDDTGAYLVGSLLGRHRLFERISPKKSWEGFFGGLILVLLSSQVFSYYYPEVGWFHWLGLGAVVVVFGTWGDLVESLLKRTLGIKDSGKILPGHGGMLDRFDSVLMAIPAVYLYLELFIRN